MNTEQRRIDLLKAKAALIAEEREERAERKKRLDIRRLRIERKKRVTRKATRVAERVKKERKAVSFKAWKERDYKKKDKKIPKDIDFRSAEHSTSQKRYSWRVRIAAYNYKTESNEVRLLGVSSSKKLSPRAVKEKALKALYATETSPNFEIHEIVIKEMTIDRGYGEIL